MAVNTLDEAGCVDGCPEAMGILEELVIVGGVLVRDRAFFSLSMTLSCQYTLLLRFLCRLPDERGGDKQEGGTGTAIRLGDCIGNAWPIDRLG